MTKKKMIKRIVKIVILLTIGVYIFQACVRPELRPEFGEEYLNGNQERMLEAIEMAKNGELKVHGIGINAFNTVYDYTFELPWRYRDLASKGLLYFKNENGDITVLFADYYDWEGKIWEGYQYSENPDEIKQSGGSNWSLPQLGG